MGLQYEKLNAFINQISLVREFFDGLPPRNTDSKLRPLIEYTDETFWLFNQSQQEYKKNLNECTTQFQQDSVRKHYYESTEQPFAYYTLAWELAVERGNEGSSNYRKQNHIPIERITDYKANVTKVWHFIKQMNPDNANKSEKLTEPPVKIKWQGSIEQFGFIFGELAAKGFIELPTKNGEGAFSKLAELCLIYFELQTTKGKNTGKQTTLENLERALNPETNLLSVKGKASLQLPVLKELK